MATGSIVTESRRRSPSPSIIGWGAESSRLQAWRPPSRYIGEAKVIASRIAADIHSGRRRAQDFAILLRQSTEYELDAVARIGHDVQYRVAHRVNDGLPGRQVDNECGSMTLLTVYADDALVVFDDAIADR